MDWSHRFWSVQSTNLFAHSLGRRWRRLPCTNSSTSKKNVLTFQAEIEKYAKPLLRIRRVAH